MFTLSDFLNWVVRSLGMVMAVGLSFALLLRFSPMSRAVKSGLALTFSWLGTFMVLNALTITVCGSGEGRWYGSLVVIAAFGFGFALARIAMEGGGSVLGWLSLILNALVLLPGVEALHKSFQEVRPMLHFW